MERQIDILGALKGQNNELNAWTDSGLFDWIHLLKKIDDKKTVEICGSDSAVYLNFLNESYRLFGKLSIVSIIMLILYITGHPSYENDFKNNEEEILAMT